MADQIAFDLVNNSTQHFLTSVKGFLPVTPSQQEQKDTYENRNVWLTCYFCRVYDDMPPLEDAMELTEKAPLLSKEGKQEQKSVDSYPGLLFLVDGVNPKQNE